MLDLELGANYFGVTDYILLGATLIISLLIGLYYGYKSKQTNEELLVGGRNMSILPVAASVMVTYVSAITILGFPSEVYAYGAQIFVLHIVSAIGIPISALLLMPFFYRMKLTSINEYLEKRFDSKWIRWLASVIFILQQVTLSGVVLYAPSIALDAFLGFPMWMSVLGIGVCATIYTNIGGLKAVVWTDAFQFLMMVSGMVAIVWKGITASGGFMSAFHLANQRGRLEFFDFTFDPFTRHNFWNFLIGTGFHAIMQPGIHQLQVQRYSGMPSCSKAKQAIIWSVPLKLIVMSLCLITGFSIFAFYANCDPLTKGGIKKIDQIVPYFVVHELADIPGMMGIFTSCIFSAVLSSLSSSLNSLAAVTWEDFLVRHKYFRAMTPRAQTNVSRLIGVIYGIICMGLAFSAQNLGAIYSATFAVIGATAGALYGVFLMGLFFPFVNSVGAIVGTLVGFVSLVIISVGAFLNKKAAKATLSLSVEGCPATELESYFNSTTPIPEYEKAPLISQISFDDWPWKVLHLSYLLYPVAAALISIIVGILVSILASICSSYYRKKKPLASLLHPLIRPISGCCSIADTYYGDGRNERTDLGDSYGRKQRTDHVLQEQTPQQGWRNNHGGSMATGINAGLGGSRANGLNSYGGSRASGINNYGYSSGLEFNDVAGRRGKTNGGGIPMNPLMFDTAAAYIQPKRESQGRINTGYYAASTLSMTSGS